MLTLIPQRSGVTVSRRVAEPLQSRASQNTWTAPHESPQESVGKGCPMASSHKRQAVKAQAKTPGKVPGAR